MGCDPPSDGRLCVLVIDDDPHVLRSYERTLTRHGWHVEAFSDGRAALELLGHRRVDVVLSDVHMPHVTGVELLRAVRAHDADLPVVLVTGAPELATAIQAVEYGAFRYLVKPVESELLDDTLRRAAGMQRLAGLKREASELVRIEAALESRASLDERFSRALQTLAMAYQPIVSLRRQTVFGYEALVRSSELSMRRPDQLLDAAEALGRVHDLGRGVRARVAQQAALVPDGLTLFINLHAHDLNDPELYDTDAPLAKIAPRVVLEITERTSLAGVDGITTRVASLRAMGFQIAVDDLGAGYAGLTSYSQLDPNIVKLDMSLVRGIDQSVRKQKIVGSMKQLFDELGTVVVAEGVETVAECETLATLGCDLLQGYLFARPQEWAPTSALITNLPDLLRLDPVVGGQRPTGRAARVTESSWPG